MLEKNKHKFQRAQKYNACMSFLRTMDLTEDNDGNWYVDSDSENDGGSKAAEDGDVADTNAMGSSIGGNGLMGQNGLISYSTETETDGETDDDGMDMKADSKTLHPDTARAFCTDVFGADPPTLMMTGSLVKDKNTEAFTQLLALDTSAP